MKKLEILFLWGDFTLNYSQKEESKEKKDEKEKKIDNTFQKECLNLLINLLSSKKQLLEEFTSEDENEKEEMINIFKFYFTEKGSNYKDYFIQNLTQSIGKAKNTKNNNYIKLLFQLINSILDTFSTKTF